MMKVKSCEDAKSHSLHENQFLKNDGANLAD